MHINNNNNFWLSFASIYIPDSGILAAYDDTAELEHAVGFYLAVWFIFTFIMLYVKLFSLLLYSLPNHIFI